MKLKLSESPLKQAIIWMSKQKLDDSNLKKIKLIESASIKFDLNPNESEYLSRNF